MQKATKKDRDDKIFNVFLEERLIPMPINHRLSKIDPLWKIHELNWNKYPNTNWIIKPIHDHRIRKEISTDELFKLIFHQARKPTEREKQQMADRMGAELRAFMGTPPVGGVRELQDRAVVFPDNTHSKCKKTLGEVLNFLETRYNTVYSQLGRSRNRSRFRMSKKRCPPGCVKKSPKKSSRKRKSRKRSRKRKSRKRSRKRKSRKRSRKRKSRKRSRKRKSRKRSRKRKSRKRSRKRKSRKTKFSAGNKIPATHEADKKLSKAAKAWRKASMDCFAENGKATMKIKRLTKKLRKCSRNLTLSRELLKASKKKKSRKNKFRNGDGKQKEKPKLVFNDRRSQELMREYMKAVKNKKPVVLYPTKRWMHEGFGTPSDR